MRTQTKVEMELQSIRNNVQTLVDTLCPVTNTNTTESHSSDDATTTESADDDASAAPKRATGLHSDLHSPIAASVSPATFQHTSSPDCPDWRGWD